MFSSGFSTAVAISVTVLPQPSLIAQNPSQISNSVRNITVRIAGYKNGSGIIFARRGNNYSVLTNKQVVPLPLSDTPYVIQTADGAVYQVTKIEEIPDLDLAILQFQSDRDYQLAEWGDSASLNEGQSVSVVWFSGESNNIEAIEVEIAKIKEKILENPEQNQGYALTYSNQNFSQINGGAILDEKGRVVGIEGLGYSGAGATKINLGIPINLFLATLEEETTTQEERRIALEQKLFNNANLSQLPFTENAKNIAVKITGQGDGSGVIFLKEENVYSVVTNQHVTPVKSNYQVRTHDGIEHQVINQQIIPGLDLAIVQFASDRDYYTANLGNSAELELLQPIYVVGFPDTQIDPAINSGEITTIKEDILKNPFLEEGYALLYSNNTFAGTSGGAVLDEEGILMGINGAAYIDPGTGRNISKGIPINLFIDSWIELNLESN